MRANQPTCEAGLLRQVAVQAQPRVLALPARPGRLTTPVTPPAASSQAPAALAQAAPAAVPPNAPAVPPPAPEPTPASVYEDARARGLRDGHAAGLQQGLADAERRLDEACDAARAEWAAQARRAADEAAALCEQRRQHLDAVVDGLGPLLQARLDELEAEAIELAFEVICRILGDAASRHEVVESLVTHAFTQLRSAPLRVRLHPADLALIGDEGGLRQRHPHVQWMADAAVTSGGCLIDGTAGTLDARLDLQLQRLLQCWRDRGPSVGEPAR